MPPSKLSHWSCLATGLAPFGAVALGPSHVAGTGVAHGMNLASAWSLPSVAVMLLAAVFIVVLSVVIWALAVPAIQDWRDKRAARSRSELAALNAKTARSNAEIARFNAAVARSNREAAEDDARKAWYREIRARMNARRSIRRKRHNDPH